MEGSLRWRPSDKWKSKSGACALLDCVRKWCPGSWACCRSLGLGAELAQCDCGLEGRQSAAVGGCLRQSERAPIDCHGPIWQRKTTFLNSARDARRGLTISAGNILILFHVPVSSDKQWTSCLISKSFRLRSHTKHHEKHFKLSESLSRVQAQPAHSAPFVSPTTHQKHPRRTMLGPWECVSFGGNHSCNTQR